MNFILRTVFLNQFLWKYIQVQTKRDNTINNCYGRRDT
jgi:hypothetical protein